MHYPKLDIYSGYLLLYIWDIYYIYIQDIYYLPEYLVKYLLHFYCNVAHHLISHDLPHIVPHMVFIRSHVIIQNISVVCRTASVSEANYRTISSHITFISCILLPLHHSDYHSFLHND